MQHGDKSRPYSFVMFPSHTISNLLAVGVASLAGAVAAGLLERAGRSAA